MARRDSILKHAGSVKNTDRRVSINQPVVVEYMSEKRPSGQQSSAGNLQQSSSSSSSINYNLNKSNARPASLILVKNERPTFKLIRSPSFDQDQDDPASTAATTNSTSITTNFSENASASARDDDEVDESIPLVQPSDKQSNTKITNSINYT